MGKGARGTNVVKNAAEVGKMVKQAHMLRRTKGLFPNNVSEIKFKKNREKLSERLQNTVPNSTGPYNGW